MRCVVTITYILVGMHVRTAEVLLLLLSLTIVVRCRGPVDSSMDVRDCFPSCRHRSNPRNPSVYITKLYYVDRWLYKLVTNDSPEASHQTDHTGQAGCINAWHNGVVIEPCPVLSLLPRCMILSIG
ncbi:hypothetical protein P170DRAFT_255532 [Aspergillus steynii IBT 23096]|uniref:Secreted protein n=1 Tax=Aspergillus steynii IBT 23096 TaxID=1392250 RepID=A0A2I2FZC1_9EURO|nr:uncharacterized protein P170DRAFT_255532 [Aspergillus steynii IBT 23096]PLB45906.1 hypothetical protein P170DRAFT_255532 [Aspergillus steynii IBT 23096]